MKAPCLTCDHHLQNQSKDCELCLSCAARLEYARATDGDCHVIQLGPERDLPERYERDPDKQVALCVVDECDREAQARGMCWKHYRAWRRGNSGLVEKFGVFKAVWMVGEGRVRVRTEREAMGIKPRAYHRTIKGVLGWA